MRRAITMFLGEKTKVVQSCRLFLDELIVHFSARTPEGKVCIPPPANLVVFAPTDEALARSEHSKTGEKHEQFLWAHICERTEEALTAVMMADTHVLCLDGERRIVPLAAHQDVGEVGEICMRGMDELGGGDVSGWTIFPILQTLRAPVYEPECCVVKRTVEWAGNGVVRIV